jgi:putative transposase
MYNTNVFAKTNAAAEADVRLATVVRQAAEHAMNKKRHSMEEITAKLTRADELAAQGKPQREIARAIGISVMTYHRWRKANAGAIHSSPVTLVPATDRPRRSGSTSELELENLRLRRLVTDLLLEKMRLEEAVPEPQHEPRAPRR